MQFIVPWFILPVSYRNWLQSRAPEPEVKHRIITAKEPVCLDFETCLIYFFFFFSKFTPLDSTASCNDFNNLYENVSFVCFKPGASLLVLRLWEAVSIASTFPFSILLLVLQTWFYFPIHLSHEFLKLKSSGILRHSVHKRTIQPNTFMSIIHSGIFANGKKKPQQKWNKPQIIWGEYGEVMDLIKWGKCSLHVFPWQPCL